MAIRILASLPLVACATAALAQDGQVYARDYPSIQAAIDACPANESWTVHLEPQTYNLTATINLHSGITLQGQPTTTLSFPSPFVPALSASGTQALVTTTVAQVADPHVLKVANASSFVPGDMIYVDGGSNIDSHANEVTEVVNTTTVNVRYARLATVAQGMPVYKVTPADAIAVKSCRINGSSNSFIFNLCRDTNIDTVQINGSVYNPIFLGSLRPRVYNSSVTTVGGGLSFQSSTSVTCSNNSVTDYKLGGIFLRACSDGAVRNNTLVSNHAYAQGGNSGDGISVAFSTSVRVVENQMTNTSCYGMWVQDSQHCLVQKNTVVNSYTSAYYVTDSTNCTLIDNVSKNISNAHGVVFERGTGSLVQGNTSQNVQVGFVILGTANMTYGKNYADSCALDTLFSANTGMVLR